MRQAPQATVQLRPDCTGSILIYPEDRQAIARVREQTPLVFGEAITAERRQLCGDGCRFSAEFKPAPDDRVLAAGCLACDKAGEAAQFRQVLADVLEVIRGIAQLHAGASELYDDAVEAGSGNPLGAYYRYLETVPPPKTLMAIANSRCQTGKPTITLKVNPKYL